MSITSFWRILSHGVVNWEVGKSMAGWLFGFGEAHTWQPLLLRYWAICRRGLGILRQSRLDT